MPQSWKRLVAEGRRAVRMQTGAMWTLGDLAQEVADQQVDEYANEIGVDAERLKVYRRTAQAWPEEKRIVGAPFEVHVILRGRDDRFALAAKLRKRKSPIRLDEVRKMVGHEARSTDRTAEDKADTVKRHLKDPAVRKRIAEDREGRKAVRQAGAEAAAKAVAEVDEREREAVPDLRHADGVLTVIGRLESARFQVNKALDEVREFDLDEEELEELGAEADGVRTSLDWLDSYIASGDTSFDEQLAQLLTEGEK
jgi:hypothetical protein